MEELRARIPQLSRLSLHLRHYPSLNNLAGLYYNQGRYSEAEPLFISAVSIIYQALGAEHPNTNTVLENFYSFLSHVEREGQEEVLSDNQFTQALLQQIKDNNEGDSS